MKNAKKIFLLVLIVGVLFLALRGWNDEDLFTTVVRTGAKPNVVFLQDCSGSMREGIYHPDYNPNQIISDVSTTYANFTNIDDNLTRTLWHIRWYYVNGTTKRIYDANDGDDGTTDYTTIASFTSPTLVVGSLGSNIKVGDWILQYDSSDASNLAKQAVAKVTAKTGPVSSQYTLTLSDIQGTFTATRRLYIRNGSYNASYMSARVVCLYGTNIKQSNVWYDQDSENYAKWLFAKTDETQRQQISMFSLLGAHIEQRCYTDRVSPLAATNPDNTAETLLAEWNRVWPQVFPNKIAALGGDITSSAISISYSDAKASFQGYLSGFYIKIDSETMLVNSNTPGSTTVSGTLTVTRAQKNTQATSHPSGSKILIYNQAAPLSPVINEYTPASSLFSSTQHVDEPTGMVDMTWTENIDPDGNGTYHDYYRYKRVFSRIQVAREALADVATAKNKLLKVAELENTIGIGQTSFTYLMGTANFVTMDPAVATFYIKVMDPANPDDDEIMLVTGHDTTVTPHELTVTRAQNGTTAYNHNIGSAIQIYTGVRDEVIIGLFTFASTIMRQALTDFGQKNADGTYLPASYINGYLDSIWDNINATSATPLAVALADVWQYFKPGSSSSTGSDAYRTSGTDDDWQVVTKNWGFETLADGHPHPKGSPVLYWCQNNYVVVVTDGQANGDSVLKASGYGVFYNKLQRTAAPTPGEYCRWNYANGWGDLDARDTNHDTSGLYCPGNTCWLNSNSPAGTDYLDDVAYFMYHQDMFPTRKVVGGQLVTASTLYNEVDSDPYKVWDGDQNISTYTVGLTIRNDMLTETAANGHGMNFTASNYQELSDSFLSIMDSIKMREDPMMYTTYAAPKQSVTSGKYGYVAHFVPRADRSMWEGHLRRFRLGDDGNFPENIDLLDASNRGAVTATIDGVPTSVPSYQWDVETLLLGRTTARTVYTAKGDPKVRVDFNNTQIVHGDLGVDTDAKRDTIINFITNFNSTYTTYKYGDTFHFNPLLVGYPLKWKSFYDASYLSFYNHYSGVGSGSITRKEVVYVGANDGKLHCFLSETDTVLGLSGGHELWSFIPPSQLKRLQKPALNPSATSGHTYFVDGKALVKDIRVSTTYNDYRDWKTVIFFGMGLGGLSVGTDSWGPGHSYCALDVTDPMNPIFLWEFDDGYDPTSRPDGRMGLTEAKPVVVDINNGSTTFPAVILAGGYNMTEVPADSDDDGIQEYIKEEGKALYILNAATGALVKKFIYGTSITQTGDASIGYTQTNPGFTCAMTSAPAVLDKTGDGIADCIYQADTGDYHVANNRGAKIWKIECLGDPANWQVQELYQADAGQTIFISPSLGFDASYRVLVMFGTGRRSQPTEASGSLYTNLTGQFVSFFDTGSGPLPLSNANLIDITTALSTETGTSFDMKDTNGATISYGFYSNFVKGSNEILFEPSPLFLASRVYFMTFSPQGSGGGGSSDDPCSCDSADGGQHYIYNFGLSTQGSTISITSPTATPGKLLGYGALSGTEYKLYIGESNVGGFVSTATPPIELDNVFGPMLWKEDKK
jgi:hypothetical protein